MQLETVDLPSGIRQIKLTGRLDVQGAGAIDNKFAFTVTTAKTPVVIDLSGVEFIASIGMRLLLLNAKSLNTRGGKLALCQPQPLVHEALATAGIDLLIPIYDDLDTACAALLQTTATS